MPVPGGAPKNVTAASVPSFGFPIFGPGSGWSSIAGDCTVEFPGE